MNNNNIYLSKTSNGLHIFTEGMKIWYISNKWKYVCKVVQRFKTLWMMEPLTSASHKPDWIAVVFIRLCLWERTFNYFFIIMCILISWFKIMVICELSEIAVISQNTYSINLFSYSSYQQKACRTLCCYFEASK